jgi:hypothetical protein
MTFSLYGNFMSSILTCGPFLHRIPTIQRRREGTDGSIEMSNEGTVLMEAANKILNQHLLSWPQGRLAKKVIPYASSYIKIIMKD